MQPAAQPVKTWLLTIMQGLTFCKLKTASVYHLDGWYGSWEMHTGQHLVQVLLHCGSWHMNLHPPHNGRHHPCKDSGHGLQHLLFGAKYL